MKFNNTLTEIVRTDLEIGAVPALMGEPGIGKSSFVEDLAKQMDTQSFTLSCNQLADKADLTGARLVPTMDGKSYEQVFYPHSTVQQAIEYAHANPREWPILFFDEITRTSPDVTSAALTMVTERRLGKEKFPDNLRMMVAGNDKGNVVALDEASISRFSIYRVEPEAQTLLDILGDAINPHVKTVLMKHPNLVFERGTPSGFVFADGDDEDDQGITTDYQHLLDSGEEMIQLTTPRTIDSVSRWLNAVSVDKLQEYLQASTTLADGSETTMLEEIIEAHVGNTTFAKHLVAEIATAISSGTVSQASGLTAPRPNCYDALKQARTTTDLENLIQGLTEHEKSGSLVYALFEREDNRVIVEQLVMQLDEIERDHLGTLVQLAAQSLLDDKNVQVLFSCTTPVAETTKLMLSTFIS